ncbi:MAG: acyltransferase domain-containing protein [Pseudonocardiaceae bacterium]
MRSRPREVALLFPGQGAQHTRMAAGLYGVEPVFSRTIDTVLDLFGDDRGLREAWLSDEPRVPLDDVTRAQPLLFTVGYALGCMVLHWGVRPAALLGHSVGELVAATLAGVFDLEDAVALMRDRVARLATTPPGGMLTVSASESDLHPVLSHHPKVAIGAVNAPRQTVLTGFDAPLRAISAELDITGFTVLPVAARNAFHSPALAPLFKDPGPLDDYVLRSPRIPLWSTFAVDRLDGETARNPVLWANQLIAPVLFWPTLDKLLNSGHYLLADVGPGQGLAMVARRHSEVKLTHSAVTALLPARSGIPEADRKAVAQWLRQVHAEGHRIEPGMRGTAGFEPGSSGPLCRPHTVR